MIRAHLLSHLQTKEEESSTKPCQAKQPSKANHHRSSLKGTGPLTAQSKAGNCQASQMNTHHFLNLSNEQSYTLLSHQTSHPQLPEISMIKT